MSPWDDDELRQRLTRVRTAAATLDSFDLAALAAGDVDIDDELQQHITAASQELDDAMEAYRQRQGELGLS